MQTTAEEAIAAIPPMNKDDMEDLSRRADAILTAAERDPRCNWTDLPPAERTEIQKTCEKLFRWFSCLPANALSDTSAIMGDARGKTQREKPCFSEDTATFILERYQEKKKVDFEEEFGIEQDLLIVALMHAIWAEQNSYDVDFGPICDAVDLDCGTYHMVKQFLRETGGPLEKTPRALVQSALCTPVDCCITITMAYAEAKGWPMRIDWSSLDYATVDWSAKDIAEFDEMTRNLAIRHYGKAPHQSRDVDELIEQIERETIAMQQTMEADLEELRASVADIRNTSLRETREEVNAMRDNLVATMMPECLRDRPKLSEKHLQEIDEETEDAKRQLAALEAQWNAYQSSASKLTLRSRLTPQLGQLCLAFTDKGERAGYRMALIVDQVEENVYQVQFLDRSLMQNGELADDVTDLHGIAIVEMPMYDLDLKSTHYVGLRVVALTETPYGRTEWSAGTIAALPTSTHAQEFLVFFDDGFEGYVAAPLEINYEAAMRAEMITVDETTEPSIIRKKFELLKMFPLARQSLSLNGNDLDNGRVYRLVRHRPDTRRFLQRYFEKYPDWPLVRMKKPTADRPPQVVIAYDKFRKRQNVQVVCVDRSMAVLRFPPPPASFHPGSDCFEYPCTERNHKHNDEWVFRGSPRITVVNLENFANNNMSSRRMAKNRSQFDVVDPDTAANEPEHVQRTARKSNIPMLPTASASAAYRPKKRSEREERELAMKKAKEKQFTTVQRDLPPLPGLPQAYHSECTSDCLHGLDRDPYDDTFKQYSPLLIPFLCGWQRVEYCIDTLPAAGQSKARSDTRIIYRSPCGRTFINRDAVKMFLRETSCQLTIDLFSFDPKINPFSAIEVPADSVKVADYSMGLEHMPIPAVNTIDNEEPPEIAYGARRFPHDNRVDLSTINAAFCSGCTCADDCSDASRCECQQLTQSNVKRLAASFRPRKYGYQYRSLVEKTISGIFECNDNCGCNRKKCFNRVVQHPIKYPIQLYKTAQCGWGVRTLVDIPAGAFIANYVGALLTDGIADEVTQGEDAYFADLDLNDVVENEKASAMEVFGHLDVGIGSSDDDDSSQSSTDAEDEMNDGDSGAGSDGEFVPPKKEKGKVEKKKKRQSRRKKMNDDELDYEPPAIFKWSEYFVNKNSLYVIDARNKGNIGRFLNHSCDPNVSVQHVLVDTHDMRLPWSAFFAQKNIRAGEELCWNYGYQPEAMDQDRPLALQLHCQCGAANCQGRLL